MCLNSILDFLFEAFKRDAQLAALLVKTTKLMDSVFLLIVQTMDSSRDATIKMRNRGLLSVFIDKVVKILHVALLHPQDYSVDLISKFVFQQQISDEGRRQPRKWMYLVEMFQVIENYDQTRCQNDIKLSLVRFISEFMIQTAHFDHNYLDENVDLNQTIVSNMYQGDFTTYGSLLFIEFAKVFKSLYQIANSPENHLKDICLCLQVLFSSCVSAKTHAVE